MTCAPKTKRPIVLSAGGTGGHLFPAQALAEELARRNHTIHLMADHRVRDHGDSFPAAKVHIIPSATITPKQPLKLPGQLYKLISGVIKARSTLGRMEPLAVIGFGGYPSFPPLIAAISKRIPSLIHEQNAIMGRANTRLAPYVSAVASSFAQLTSLAPNVVSKVSHVGNPVRDCVLAASLKPYQIREVNHPFRLLVFGGSQGAQVFSQIVPSALMSLPNTVRKLLTVTQQVRPEDMCRVQDAYLRCGIDVELASFFHDMPQRIANAHLVISRSGGSTIAELGVIGRPAILVPLPRSLDNDQLLNARAFTRNGAGWLLEQHDFNPDRLSALITELYYSKGALQAASDSAKLLGKADAAKNLADLVENTVLNTTFHEAGVLGKHNQKYKH